MTDNTQDTEQNAPEVIWPDEIWAAELDEFHNGQGDFVTSEFATIPRYEGDDERNRDFERYVHGNIFDTSDRYWRERCAAKDARIAELEAALQFYANPKTYRQTVKEWRAENNGDPTIAINGIAAEFGCVYPEIWLDKNGNKARAALKGDTNG